MSIERRIQYTKGRDYRVFPVTGAFGGLNVNGELMVDLFIEKMSLPTEEKMTIDESTGHIEHREIVGQTLQRESQLGLVIRPDIAYSIGKWLINKAEQAGIQIPPDDMESSDE